MNFKNFAKNSTINLVMTTFSVKSKILKLIASFSTVGRNCPICIRMGDGNVDCRAAVNERKVFVDYLNSPQVYVQSTKDYLNQKIYTNNR